MGKLSRLRGMPTDEIGYRLRERVRLEAERFRVGLRRVAPARQSLPRLQSAFAANFYPVPARSFVQRNFPQWIDEAIHQADALCEHRLELLGYGEVHLGARIDWHRDPVTKVVWSRRFWADYDPVNDVSCGDSKIIHELNRHQHLPRLAKAYFLTGDDRYAREAVAQMESWIDQNPVGMGINWQSSLEIAIRALSWLWTIFFLQASPDLTERITESLRQQLRHVCAYPSIYSSPNTHLIGEAAALFIAGLLLGGASEANRWREFGADLLIQEAQRQILDDGMHCELSTCYHCYALDFYLHALILARRSGYEFPTRVLVKVERMLECVMHLTRPDGSLPQLGDDDGGRALALDRRDYRSYVDGLCVGAALFQRTDFKWQASAFCQEALWLLGEEGWLNYQSLPAVPPEANSRALASAGYLVHRTGWSPDDSHAVFDCGGLGALTGGHGHADALSVTLFAGGRDLLVDPGTGVYNADAEKRAYFRSTAAHNTVVVDGREQSEPAGTFQWETRAAARVVSHRDIGNLYCAEGEHDGYRRLAAPVWHRRRVSSRGLGWVIADEFSGRGEHTFDFFFHFAPGVELRVMPESGPMVRAAAGDACAMLRFQTSARMDVQVLEGWVSPRYGRCEPASVLRLRIKTAPPLLVSTVVMPFQKGREACAEFAEL